MGKFDSITISEALEQVGNRNYLLPVFQRDFKWCNDGSEKIEKLFNSLMNDYPIGSMLFWKVNSDSCVGLNFYYFNEKAVENPERVKNNKYIQGQCGHLPNNDFYAVLDGQQRLTALRIGLFGEFYEHPKNKSWDFLRGEFIKKVLYFNISKKNKSNDYDFKFLEIDTGKDIYIDNDNNKWFKVKSIVGYNREYKESNIDVSDYYTEYDFESNEKKNINKLRKIIFEDKLINYYEEITNDVDRAMRIFTRINNEGEPLTYPEIIYSIIKANWSMIDAREEIERLIENEKNNGFRLTIEYIVKAFLFLYNKNIKNEIKSFDNDFCLLIEKNWETIKKSIRQTFELLRSYGMIEENLLSYNATLPILYYIHHKRYKKFANAKKYSNDRKEIKKWLYQALLRHFFSSRTDRVLEELREAFKPDFDNNKYIDNSFSFDSTIMNEKISSITTITQEELDKILDTRKDNRSAFLILSLLYPNIDYRKEIEIHKDHLHSEKDYKSLNQIIKDKYSKDKYDSIVNLQLLTNSENTSKKASSLEDWVNSEVLKLCNQGNYNIIRKEFLNKQIIPDIDLNLNNFEEFYEERKKMLEEKLKNLI